MRDNGLIEIGRSQGVRAIRHSCWSAGWSLSVSQIDPGPLHVSVVGARAALTSLVRVTADRRLELVGRSPQNTITVVTVADRSKLWANAQRIDEHDVLLLQPGSAFHVITSDDCCLSLVHIPKAIVEPLCAFIEDPTLIEGEGARFVIRPGTKDVARLRRLTAAAINHTSSGPGQAGRQFLLSATLAEIVDDWSNSKRGLPADREVHRIISRARQFIEANMSNSISIGDMCAYSATSMSKLERTFRRELRLTPSRYVLARRLAAVRRALQGGGEKLQVAQVATDHGFSHLGRFAAVYRRHFDELPSETARIAGSRMADYSVASGGDLVHAGQRLTAAYGSSGARYANAQA